MDEVRFENLYAETDKSFKPYDTGRWWGSVWCDLASLPSDPTRHVRGWISAKTYFLYGDEDGSDVELPRTTLKRNKPFAEIIKPHTFHSHPTSWEFPNIPTWADVYDFLNWRYRKHTIVGRDTAWTLVKTDATLDLVERLWKWEKGERRDGKWTAYKRNGLRNRANQANTKAIKLKEELAAVASETLRKVGRLRRDADDHKSRNLAYEAELKRGDEVKLAELGRLRRETEFAILNADAPPDVLITRSEREPTGQHFAHSLCPLGKHLKRVPVRHLHYANNLLDVRVGHAILKEIAHRVDEHRFRR
jgi:hypothetical protein